MVRKEIFTLLDVYRTADATDPRYKWIGTFNLSLVILVGIINWLCFPQLASTATRPVNDFRFAGLVGSTAFVTES